MGVSIDQIDGNGCLIEDREELELKNGILGNSMEVINGSLPQFDLCIHTHFGNVLVSHVLIPGAWRCNVLMNLWNNIVLLDTDFMFLECS